MIKNLVSIIIPVYNAENFISDTIESVLNQTYKNWELILIDDISKDHSVEIIKQIKKENKKIKLIELKEKGLAFGARNIGVKEAQGEYICFLDADDIWDIEKLEKQIKFMKQNLCAFSFTGYEFANSELIKSGHKVYVPRTLNYKHALKNTTIFTSTVMFNMNKISKELIMMPNIKSEDTACWWNILRHNYVAYGLNEILVLYRRSENTLSSNKVEAVKRIWNLYRNYENLNLFSSVYNFTFYGINAIKRRI